MTLTPKQFLQNHLGDPTTGFSIGCLGAIAEFQEPGGATCDETLTGALVARSPRGAVRIDCLEGIEPVAYEALSAKADAWQCGVVFCARGHASRPNAVLTEIGPDLGAIHERDRDALLFDVGIAMDNVQFNVRTRDPQLIELLRAHAGERITGDGHPIMERIVDASPHRVAASAIGRIEVYQRIDRHKTPSGPHTHLLPQLLAKRRTHSANVPVPGGTLPVLTLHPENPLVDHEGERRTFASAAHDRFEAILLAFGPREYVTEKARVRAAVAAGTDPATYRRPASRLGRLAARIALRQLGHEQPACSNLGPWLERFRP